MAHVLPAKRIGRLYFVYGGDLVPERTLTKEQDSVEWSQKKALHPFERARA